MEETEINPSDSKTGEKIRPKRKRKRLNQRRRKKLKEKLAQQSHLPKIVAPTANTGEPNEADLRTTLRAKRPIQRSTIKQTSCINNGDSMYWETTEVLSTESEYSPTKYSHLSGPTEEVDLTGVVDLDGRPLGCRQMFKGNDNEQRHTAGLTGGRPRLAVTSESSIDRALWIRVAEGAKQAMKKDSVVQDEEGFRVWEGTNEEQRSRWARCWPKVNLKTLETLIDDTPRFSTLDTHTDISLKLTLAAKITSKYNQERAESLMEAARWHLRIVTYIDKCNHNNSKPADDHICHYTMSDSEDELVITTSAEDRNTLGLLPHSTTPPPHPPSLVQYNPLNKEDNAETLWISPEKVRLEKWMAYTKTKYEIKSIDDAKENFVAIDDDLTNVNPHAKMAIKLMKMRGLVHGKEIRHLLFKTSQSHLRVVSHFHSKGWRETLKIRLRKPLMSLNSSYE